MELYVLGMGRIPCLKQWANDLQACFLNVVRKKGGKKPTHMIRMGVGEVKLYKLFFPEPQLQNVLGLIGMDESYLTKYPFLGKRFNWIRRLLKLKKIPKATKIYKHMLPNKVDKAVAIIPIGTRKDAVGGDGLELI